MRMNNIWNEVINYICNNADPDQFNSRVDLLSISICIEGKTWADIELEDAI